MITLYFFQVNVSIDKTSTGYRKHASMAFGNITEMIESIDGLDMPISSRLLHHYPSFLNIPLENVTMTGDSTSSYLR